MKAAFIASLLLVFLGTGCSKDETPASEDMPSPALVETNPNRFMTGVINYSSGAISYPVAGATVLQSGDWLLPKYYGASYLMMDSLRAQSTSNGFVVPTYRALFNNQPQADFDNVRLRLNNGILPPLQGVGSVDNLTGKDSVLVVIATFPNNTREKIFGNWKKLKQLSSTSPRTFVLESNQGTDTLIESSLNGTPGFAGSVTGFFNLQGANKKSRVPLDYYNGFGTATWSLQTFLRVYLLVKR